MTAQARISFSHVGLFVMDLDRMIDFYTRHLGLVVTDRAPTRDGKAQIAFLTGDAREHHQVVFATGRPADMNYNMVQQLSFRLDSLATLRKVYAGLRSEPIVELGPVTHGNALSAYFRDPEGNRLEVFIDSKWHSPQPLGVPVDLSKPDDEIWALIDKTAREMPGSKPRAEWSAELAARLEKARG